MFPHQVYVSRRKNECTAYQLLWAMRYYDCMLSVPTELTRPKRDRSDAVDSWYVNNDLQNTEANLYGASCYIR